MKLSQLALLRYGHLSDMVLDLPAGAGLCVVHGANEAGKSTTLAAIGDALFGFGHRSAYDFLHGGPQLRLGFALVARDGRAGRFQRRKGVKGTLRDDEDAVLPDAALHPFLGGATRETFERGFGLDGARLRQGGLALAAGGGGLGESLFAAGTGLLGLRGALAGLDEDAKALVGDGRGKRRMMLALDDWKREQRRAEDLTVLPRSWQAAEQEHAAAVAELASLQDEVTRLAAETNRLQRVRRMLPVLAGLEQARAVLWELGTPPALPLDADRLLRAATAARDQATADLRREQAEALRLTELRASLPRDAAVLDAQDAIAALAGQQPLAAQAEADLPALRLEVASLRAEIAEAGAALGRDAGPDALGQAMPGAAARRGVQRLVAEQAGLRADAAAAQRDLAAARERLAQAEAALLAAPAPRDPALLRATIEQVRGEGRIEAELAQATSRAASLLQAATLALRALPLWQGDAEALAACRMPLPQATDDAGAEMAAAAAACTAAEAALVALAGDIRAAEDALAHEANGDTLPTPAAIRAARQARDQAWRQLRRTLEHGAAEAAPDPDRFEELRDEADRLADRRADEARRVATYVMQTELRQRLVGRQDEARAVLDAATRRQQAAEATWQALWAPSGLRAAGHADMAGWRRERADILRQHQDAAEAARQQQDLATRRDAAWARLKACLPGLEAESLAAALTQADVACAQVEAAWQAHGALQEARRRELAALPRLQAAADAAALETEAWQARWGNEVAALGLEASCPAEAAEAALEAWARVAEAWPAWRNGTARIGQMEATISGFAQAAEALRVALGAAEEPPALVAAGLVRRLEAARQVEAEIVSLTARIGGHERAAVAAQACGQDAGGQLAQLRQMAGVTEDAALEPAIARARAHEAALRDEARHRDALAAQGDGLAEAALRAEAAGADPDEIVARLAALGEDASRLGSRREALSAERMRAETVLDGLRRGHDAAGAAQAARQALAEAGAAAERYARLHVARVLLRAGIDRFRRSQQGPLLQAASRNFAALTLQRYARLSIDEDSNGKLLLVAVRADGSECPIEALSEGTRDQLYLALRVAAVEQHALAVEPLPFVADDLLVQFDDGRSLAALDLLVQLGRTTQVILFTHHDHIAGMAETRAGDGVAVLRLRGA
jgi:chromosome segregation protein